MKSIANRKAYGRACGPGRPAIAALKYNQLLILLFYDIKSSVGTRTVRDSERESRFMSEKHPECPLYNPLNCKEYYNPKLCAFVRKDKVCLKKKKPKQKRKKAQG